MKVLNNMLSNEYFMYVVMAFVIFGLTQLLKLPIKAATKRITNEKTRGIVNLVILVIPFALGLLAEFLFDGFYLHRSFYGIAGLKYGSASLLVYNIFEKIARKSGVNVHVDNPYETTEEGKAIQELIDRVQEDGQLDEADINAVKEFWDTIQTDKK